MNSRNSTEKKHRLYRQILSRVSILGALFVAVATILCYYQVNASSRSSTLNYLRQYIDERSKHENAIFIQARKHLAFFRKQFMELYLSDISFSQKEFWKLYDVDKDGATRMKKKFFDARYNAQLGKEWGSVQFYRQTTKSVGSSDFQRRLIIASILVNRYGPAWWPDEVLHVTYPENAITTFYPTSPWCWRPGRTFP